MPIEAAIYVKRYDLKNVKQVLLRPMTLWSPCIAWL